MAACAEHHQSIVRIQVMVQQTIQVASLPADTRPAFLDLVAWANQREATHINTEVLCQKACCVLRAGSIGTKRLIRCRCAPTQSVLPSEGRDWHSAPAKISNHVAIVHRCVKTEVRMLPDIREARDNHRMLPRILSTRAQHLEKVALSQVDPGKLTEVAFLSTDTSAVLPQGCWANQLKLSNIDSEVFCNKALKSTCTPA